MRIRSIKPELWRSPDFTELSMSHRLLWIGLWNLADDEGRGMADPAMIAADLFVTDLSLNPHGVITDVSRGLHELFKRDMITLFSNENRHYFEVANWSKHQKINRPGKSRFPSSKDTNSIIEDSLNPHGTLTEDSLPEQGAGNREQGAGFKTLDQTSGSIERVSRFDEFWSVFPRKVGKPKARAAYVAAAKRSDEDTVIDGARRLAEDPHLPEKQFIPHPATWLARDGWEDEPLPPRTGGHTPRVPNTIDAWGQPSGQADAWGQPGPVDGWKELA